MYSSSHTFAQHVLNTFLGITAPGYSALWVGLFISDPTPTGSGGVEVAYPGYVRQPITFTPPALFSGNMAVQSANDVTFPLSDQNAGSALFVGIYNAPVAGEMVLRGALTHPLEIRPSVQPSILGEDIIFYGRNDFTNEFRTAYLNILRGIPLPGFEPRMALFHNHPETGGVEFSGNNYERALINFNLPHLSDNQIMQIVNTNDMVFPRPTGPWGMWTHDAIARGNSSNIASSAIKDPPLDMQSNYNPRILQGDYTVSFR